MDRQTGRWTDRQDDRQDDVQTDRMIDRQDERQDDGQTDRTMDRQTGRWTDTRTEKADSQGPGGAYRAGRGENDGQTNRLAVMQSIQVNEQTDEQTRSHAVNTGE